MLKFIKSLFSSLIYIQIWENRIIVTNIDDQIIFDEKPLIAIEKNNKNQDMITAIGNHAEQVTNNGTISNPFSHPRLLVKNFIEAEKIILHAIRIVHKNTFITPAPQVVIHPKERLDGGITSIELRLFKELAYGAGARDVVVYIGPDISTHDFDFEEIKSNVPDSQRN